MREVAMKAIHSMIAALGFAFVLPAPADAAVGGPEVIIYRFPGVSDDGGGPNVRVATVFHDGRQLPRLLRMCPEWPHRRAADERG
jgi:hypothetical protein